MKPSPRQITHLKLSQCFVFGSNGFSVHGAGAAKAAFDNHPKYKGSIGNWAIWGVARGFMQGKTGYSYAIQTKQHWQDERSVPLPEIEAQIKQFIDFAKSNPNLEFLVTAFGCNRAGFTHQEIVELWRGKDIPENVLLPQEWIELL